MDFEEQAFYYNLCNPAEPLRPGDSRNVDIDKLGAPDQRVRGLAWAEHLLRRLLAGRS